MACQSLTAQGTQKEEQKEEQKVKTGCGGSDS